MNFDNYKFRCSQAGALMTEPRSKSETLSETTKTYLLECYIGAKYNRFKDITSKFLEKGLNVEEDSITLYSTIKKELFFKNEDKFSNDFICGTPDIITDDLVIDIKSSWDIFTFRKSLDSDNKNYWWQLQCYMALTGKKKSILAYCLVDTPESIITREIKKAMYQSGVSNTSESFLEYEIEMLRYYTFQDIPVEERIIEKEIEFDPDAINRLHERIIQCREYLNNL